MRTLQPNKPPRNKPFTRLKQDIPSEAARIQARLSTRQKKADEASSGVDAAKDDGSKS